MATGWKAIGGKGCYFDDQGVYQPDRNGSMMVALTFDDGPGVYTSTLLDALEQYGAQATFFMLGSNVEKYGADVIPRMAAIGCELGNHSYAHPNMKELSLDDGLAQFQMTDDLIAQYNNGQGATVIRFPYGNSTDELLASIGRPSIMWDVDTLDWQTKNVQANISAVLDSVSPGDIILMHDIHETTVESCATIVPELINRGYELVTIHTLAAANGVDLAAGETYYSSMAERQTNRKQNRKTTKNRRFTLKSRVNRRFLCHFMKIYFIAALLRSLESSSFLRIRKETGVTSRSSSLSMKSRACSRERILGGVRRSASSEEEVRVLVRCFVLQTFSSISSALPFCPITIPA